MAKFLNAVLFNPTLGGTTDFTVSAAVQGYMTPNAAGASNGAVYRYRAENATLTEWEIGYGTYNTGTGVLTRTVVLYNSLGTTAKINFTAAPNVGMGMPLATDIFPFIGDTPPTDPADGALWWESDTGILYIYFNDGTSSQWVGIQSQANIAAVLFTAQTLSDAQKKQARLNIGVSTKNYIVNSAMMVSQENGAVAGTTSGYFPVDQFRSSVTGTTGVISFAQVASATPGGSPNRIRATVTTADAAVAAGDFVGIAQEIEGLRIADLRSGSSSAKTITIQFGVKAPAGTYCVSIRNSAADRNYIAEYVISAGEANTDVVKSVTLQLDQSGTWLANNGIGFSVAWPLMAGSTFQGTASAWQAGNLIATANQFNLLGTNGNVFELFDVSLTEGTIAPPFAVPDYASELVVCQRYLQPVLRGNGGSATGIHAPFGQRVTTNLVDIPTVFSTEMRTVPSTTVTGPAPAFSSAGTPTGNQIGVYDAAFGGFLTITGALTIALVAPSATAALCRLTAATSFNGTNGDTVQLFVGNTVKQFANARM